MIGVLSSAEMRNFDSRAINEFGIPGIVLMENAGRNISEEITEICNEGDIGQVVIFAGKGNNGGDGLVIARYLDKNGIDVKVYLAAKKTALTGDAKINLDICINTNIAVQEVKSIQDINAPSGMFLIVDALLGTGAQGAVQGLYGQIIEWMNDQEALVCAVDMPSGLSPDYVNPAEPIVHADFTCSLGMPKLSQLFYPARQYIGELEIMDIGFPIDIEEDPSVNVHLVEEEDVVLAGPDATTHKHSAGRLFILGGSNGMTGAVTMAAKAASLAGTGLVVAGVAASLNTILEIKLTEQMSLALPEDKPGVLGNKALAKVKEQIEWCDTLLIGPGMGRERATLDLIRATIRYAIEQKKRMVIDADALFLLSVHKELISQFNSDVILTPHHGEFKKIAPKSFKKVELQPWKVLQEFIKGNKAVVNLKGAPSVVGQADDGLFINPTGNPGLAKGGTGDVLAGLIAGFSATGMDSMQAAVFANFIHGKAGDVAAEKVGQRSISIEDLLNGIKEVMNGLYLK